MGIAYIFCALKPSYIPEKKDGDLFIAADRGYLFCPDADVILGDFDSLGKIPNGKNVIVSPVEKDDTDAMLAVKYGLKRGYKQFIILGGTGGDGAHTTANIAALKFIANKGGRGVLVGDNQNITLIKNGKISLFGKGKVSVFAYGGNANEVNLSGMKYLLSNAKLTCDFPLGEGNEIAGEKAEISVNKGSLLIYYPSSCKVFDE